MKAIWRYILYSLMLFVTTSGGSQGQVNFTNFSPPLLDAAVTDADGNRLSGPRYKARLWSGIHADNLAPVGHPQSFLSGEGDGYFLGGTMRIAFVPAGSAVYLQVAVWDSQTGIDFSTATVRGRSTVISVILGGPGTPKFWPSNLNGLASFSISGVAVPPETQTFEVDVASLGAWPNRSRGVANAVKVPDVFVSDFAIFGKQAFVADQSHGIRILDLSDVMNPHEVVFVQFANTGDRNPYDTIWRDRIAVSENYVVYAQGSKLLVASMDMARVGDAYQEVQDTRFGEIQAMHLEGEHLYVADFYTGLHLIDLATFRGTKILSTRLKQFIVKADETRLVVAIERSDLTMVSIEDFGSTEILSRDPFSGKVLALAASGDFAYLADWKEDNQYSGLRILDVSDAEMGVFLRGGMGFSGMVTCMLAESDYLYVGKGPAGVEILDLNVPGIIPEKASFIPSRDRIEAVKLISDRVLGIADGNAGFRMVWVDPPRSSLSVSPLQSQLSITINGPFGKRVRLQESEDLINWSSGLEVILKSDQTVVNSPWQPSSPPRFFRVIPEWQSVIQP
ncbi:MAG TPA: hypothetical protein EYQ50_21040 [Verrucomicrobiales bacterium]|nr:hypothetical protein [Verrucomicrobiales bacterium]